MVALVTSCQDYNRSRELKTKKGGLGGIFCQKVDVYKSNAAKNLKKRRVFEVRCNVSDIGHLGVTVSCRPDNKKGRG